MNRQTMIHISFGTSCTPSICALCSKFPNFRLIVYQRPVHYYFILVAKP